MPPEPPCFFRYSAELHVYFVAVPVVSACSQHLGLCPLLNPWKVREPFLEPAEETEAWAGSLSYAAWVARMSSEGLEIANYILFS